MSTALHNTHNVAYNLNSYLWAISALATEELRTQCFTKTNHVDIKCPFQLAFLLNACEAYTWGIYIHNMVELTNNDPTLTLHK